MDDLLEQLVSRVLAFAWRLTGDRHRAEDLVQEAFLRAWRNRRKLREPRAARVWLFRIAANLWQDQLRRGRLPAARAGPIDEQVASRSPDPVQTAADREELDRALAALDQLPPRQREVLYLIAVEQLSLAEVCEVLGISDAAARANLSLARKRMREIVCPATNSTCT